MRCTKCGTESTTSRKFCAACGSPLSRRCPKCGAENAPSSAFCEDCGAALTGDAASAAASSPQASTAPNIRLAPEQSDASTTIEGERKTVTALFADIKGSTELMEDLDPEEARAIVDPALKLMIDAAHRYDGYVVQSTGDGIFALFGAPVAHEDHPQRALYAALRMQDELKRHSDRVRADGGLPIQARIGVNTGEVVVRSITTGAGQTEYTPIGHTTNLASRMQTLAPIGSIAATEVTRKLCEGYFILKALGATKVKGVSEPVNVYEVTGLGPLRTRLQRAAGRGLTKFVGREREMEALQHAAEQADAGHGQIVAAMAEAGAGKSRLFFEFKAKNQSGWMVLETFSVSHGKASAYFPVIDLLHGYFKIADEDDQRGRRAKVTGNVLTLDRSLEDTLPYLFNLLGLVEGEDPLGQMDTNVRKRRTLEAIKRVLLRESLNQPLMVIFEDLHWIDGETQEFLNLLADSIANAKIMLLVNYRPEYSHQWGSKTYYTQLRLDPLGKESADAMLTALLGDSANLAPLKQVIIDRTEGNPFFMEETVQVLFDEAALVRNGVVRLKRPLTELKIPLTVQAILAARIDRLQSAEKELLQTLAVIGTEFPLTLVREVVQSPFEQLDPLLASLQTNEFIYEQPAAGDVEYSFKHALTHDVAYNSLLIERRRLLHERAAQTIESLYAERLDDYLSELANHYDRSGNISKAVEYLGRTGVRAAQQAAYSEALPHLTRSLTLLRQLPDDADRARRELDLQMALAALAHVVIGAAATERETALVRARSLCSQLGEHTRLIDVLVGLSIIRAWHGQFADANRLTEEAIALARLSTDSRLLGAALAIQGLLMFAQGQFVPAREHFEQSVQLFASLPIADLGQIAVAQRSAESLLGVSLLPLGYPDGSKAKQHAAIATARHRSEPHALAMA